MPITPKLLLQQIKADPAGVWLKHLMGPPMSGELFDTLHIKYFEYFTQFLKIKLSTLNSSDFDFGVIISSFSKERLDDLEVRKPELLEFIQISAKSRKPNVFTQKFDASETILEHVVRTIQTEQYNIFQTHIFEGLIYKPNQIKDVISLSLVLKGQIFLADFDENCKLWNIRTLEDICEWEINKEGASSILLSIFMSNDPKQLYSSCKNLINQSKCLRTLISKIDGSDQSSGIHNQHRESLSTHISHVFLNRSSEDACKWLDSLLISGEKNILDIINLFQTSEEAEKYWANTLSIVYSEPFISETLIKSINFEQNDNPLVTILVPVYKNLQYTLQCLYSIYQNKPECSFEILVVDDCSPDDSAEIIRRIPGIRLTINEKNLGFLRSMNNSLSKCNGKYIYLLNNDTIVCRGFLDKLLGTFDLMPDAGIVGSQLIYSKGMLQESGCIICKDSTINPLGRGSIPYLPEHNYLREVDFCSGASILIKKDVFLKVGGFDERYAPAYFEDPDLSFAVRQLNLKTYVNPKSKIYHYESVSYGENKYQEQDRINRPKFIEKWNSTLATQKHETASRYVMWNDKPKKIALYLDCILPEIDLGAGGIDAFYFNESLIEQGYHTIFFAEHNPMYRGKYTDILQDIGVEVIYNPWRTLEEYLEKIGSKIEVVVIARIYQLINFKPLIQKYCKNAVIIFNTVDIHFLRESRAAELQDDQQLLSQAQRTKAAELDAINHFADATIVIGSQEKQMLEEDYKCRNVFHIPLMRDIPGRATSDNRSDFIFIGSAHQPNYDAIIYLFNEILPLLKEAKITNQINIIGGPLKEALSADPLWDKLESESQLNFCGFIEDLDEIFSKSLLMICPLRYGSGVKGKVATAMGYGVPVISSEIGVEGTGLINNEHVLVAHSHNDYIKHIKSLSVNDSLWTKLSNNGLQFMEENFSIKQGKEKFSTLVSNVTSRSR